MGILSRLKEITGVGKPDRDHEAQDANGSVAGAEGGSPRVSTHAAVMKDLEGLGGVDRGHSLDGARSLARIPMTKDVKAVIEAMQDRFSNAPDAMVMQALGRADGKETDVAPPAPGARRNRWIAERVAIAFDPQRDYMTHPAHSQADNLPTRTSVEFDVAKTLRHEYQSGMNLHALAAGRRAMLSANIADFMQDGPRLEERIISERQHLERQSHFQIERRFAMSPITSMEEVPDRPDRKRAWIEDALRAEHAAARAGMMHGPSILIAANAERGQRPYDPNAQMPRMNWRGLARQDAEFAKEASQIERVPDQGLRTRFRDVPGIDKAPIPPVGGKARREWIVIAIQAQNIRDHMPRPSDDDILKAKMDRMFEKLSKDASISAEKTGEALRAGIANMNKGPKKGPPPAMIANAARQNEI